MTGVTVSTGTFREVRCFARGVSIHGDEIERSFRAVRGRHRCRVVGDWEVDFWLAINTPRTTFLLSFATRFCRMGRVRPDAAQKPAITKELHSSLRNSIRLPQSRIATLERQPNLLTSGSC